MHLLPLPGSAKFVVVQTRPARRVSFIVPAHKRKITRFLGVGNRARMETTDFDVPDMLYVWDVDTSYGRFYVVERIDASGIWLRDFRIANVHQGGAICWGGEEPPRDPREMVASFWGSNFNDDLTPYPQPQDEDWLESPEYKEWHEGNVNIERMRQYMREQQQAYLESARRVEHLHERTTVEMRDKSELWDIELNENEVKVQKLGAVVRYLQERGLDPMHINRKIEHLLRIQDRIRHVRRERHGAIDTLNARLSNFTSVAANAGRTWIRGFRPGVVMNPSMRGLVMAYRMFQPRRVFQAQIGATSAEMRGYFMYFALDAFCEQGEDEQRARNAFNSRWFNEIRERWWGGLWKTAGAINNHRDHIMGTDRTIAENGCAGVVICDYNDPIYFTSNDRSREINGRRGHHFMFPCYRLEHRDDIMVAVYGEEPFTVAKSGHRYVLSRYDERSNEIQQALSEIFA